MTKPTPREAGVVPLADCVTPGHLSARAMDGLRSGAIAVVCVLAAAGLRGTLLSALGTSHVFLTLYGAVMGAALFGGPLSGVFATLLSIIVADYYWTQPIGSLSIVDVTDRIETIVFLATGLVVSFCAERAARTRRSLVRRLEVQQQETAGQVTRRLQSEAHFQRVVEAAPNAMIMIDAAGTIEMINAKAEEIFGYPRSELLGKSIDGLLPERYRPQHSRHRARFLAMPAPREMGAGRDLFGRRKDGSEFELEIGLNPLDTPDGQKIVASIVDISKRKATERTLQDSEQQIRLMFDSIRGHAIFLLDAGGHIATWNEGAALLKGYKASEIIGKHFSVFYPPDDVASGKPQLELLIAERDGRVEDEGWRIRGDCSHFMANVIISAVKDSEGRLKGFVKVTRDISARTQAEAATQQALERLAEVNRLMVMSEEIAEIGHWRVDATTQALDWSSQIYRIYGLSPRAGVPSLEEAIAFYHPEDRDRIVALVQTALDTASGFSAEARIIRPDGEVREVASWCRCDTAPDGSVSGLFGLFQDITERKRIEREHAILQERMRLATEAGQVGIWEWLIEEDRFIGDEAARRFFGFPPEPSELTISDWVSLIPAEDFDRVSAEMQACLAGERPFEAEYRVIWPNGETRYIRGRGDVFRDADGVARRMLGALWDATEMRVLTDQLGIEKERAERANRAKSDFLAMMSHEIRTPMNGIMGMNALLLDTDLESKQRKMLETIQFSADSLLTIIDDILDISKLEVGKIDLEAVDLDLAAMIEQARALMAPKAEQKGISLAVDMSAVARTALHGDSNRLRQIVLNLVSNAIKFTEEGGVTLVATVTEAGPGRARLRCEIRDSGLGISEQTKRRVFRPFVQADTSITRRFGGTGLGLSICKQLVELMEGEIGVADREGGGSIFWFEIPIAHAAAAIAGHRARETASKVPGLTAHAGHILLAEDNKVNIEVATLVLETAGYTVDVATDGHRAVEAVRRQHYDLILMDMQMPELDGLSATRKIRASEDETRRTPIIAMTANAMREDQRRCLEAGMDDYISKPFSPATLIETVERWIEESREPEAPSVPIASDEAADIPIVDPECLARLYQFLPPTKVNSLLFFYLIRSDQQIARLARLNRTLTLDEIFHEAHQIIANAGTFGTLQVQVIAARLQAACIAGDEDLTAELIDRLSAAAVTASMQLRQTFAAELEGHHVETAVESR